MKTGDAYILEESIVDPQNGIMTTKSCNLSHQKLLRVEESQTFTRSSPDSNVW